MDHIIKYLQPAFNLFDLVTNEIVGTFVLPSGTSVEATLSKKENVYCVSFGFFDPEIRIELYGLTDFSMTLFKSKNIRIAFRDMYLNRVDNKFSSNGAEFHAVLKSRSLNTENFIKEDKYFYRVLIPIKKELDFFCLFDRSSYSTETHKRTLHTYGYFGDSLVEIYCIGHKEQLFAVIDYNSKVNQEEFSSLVFATLVSFGYLTGFMPGGIGYFFSYNDIEMNDVNSMCIIGLREEINSRYVPVTSNKSRYVLNVEADYDIKTISATEFSNLLYMVHSSIEISTVLLLILESAEANVWAARCNYSVALEMLANYIFKAKEQKEQINFSIIEDDKIRNELIERLSSVIDLEYHDKLSSEIGNVLKGKLADSINYPANNNRLKMQFELLGIELFSHDRKAIKGRNDVLHGRLPKKKKIEDMNYEIYFNTTCLYTLLSLLVMKLIKYEGRVVNYPKINESVVNKKIEGDYFREV